MDGGPARVLVVDDDDAIATLLSLILLDVELPGADGWSFRRAQRALPDAAAVPVVVVSASHRVMAPSPDLIPAAVLVKPFDLDELLATVSRLTARQAPRGAS
jgi:DNA-binding response OmpR family regulator